jgi:hypothetical protein
VVFATWKNESINLWVWRALLRGLSSHVVDITGVKEMFSVSVSHRKVLLFLNIE